MFVWIREFEFVSCNWYPIGSAKDKEAFFQRPAHDPGCGKAVLHLGLHHHQGHHCTLPDWLLHLQNIWRVSCIITAIYGNKVRKKGRKHVTGSNEVRSLLWYYLPVTLIVDIIYLLWSTTCAVSSEFLKQNHHYA